MMNAARLLLLVSFVAPAMSQDTTNTCKEFLQLTCGNWLSDLSIEAGLLKSVTAADRKWCENECEKVDGCTAASFTSATNKCNLYKVDEESMFHDKKEVQTFVFCGNCNTFENSVAIEGDDIMTIDINNQNSCRTKCMEDELCNAITWDDRRNKCAMKTVQPGFKRSKKNQYNSYVFCDRFDVLPICEEGEIVQNGVCKIAPSCGQKGQSMCLEGPPCEPGMSTSSNDKCECGNIWQSCCHGVCEDKLICDVNGSKYGQCAPCGGDKNNDYQRCCPGNKCNQDGGKRRICLPNGGCAPCGGKWQPVCDNAPACIGGLVRDPHNGKRCIPR